MKRFLIFPITIILLSATPVYADFAMGVNAYKNGDFETALKEWRPLADQGFADAQWALASMYHYGDGVSQDFNTAFRWYRLAAEQGNAIAQNSLGEMYLQGQGVSQDRIRALMWFNVYASKLPELEAASRESFEKNMSLADISLSQDLARECVARSYQGC
jgi:hypothetical protein